MMRKDILFGAVAIAALSCGPAHADDIKAAAREATDAAFSVMAGALLCQEFDSGSSYVAIARLQVEDFLRSEGRTGDEITLMEDKIERHLRKQQGSRHLADLVGHNGLERRDVLLSCQQTFDEAHHRATVANARLRAAMRAGR